MSKSVSLTLLIAVATIFSVIVIAEPEWFCDRNLFLKDFMSKDILSVLGIILTITLASAAQLHIEFNKIEEHYGKKFLIKSRQKVHQAAYVLICTFVISVCLLLMKPISAESYRYQAIFNAAGIFLLWINVLVLIELTQAAFSIPPHIDE
ncbi:hypothetical protein [Methylocystis sp.]|uniref:hypothetical protein n=1 Tax=Methylocystis sp. TaxID=1911079 RepID=UPI0027370621|nr:hypothetical protein [Methylocystis sp.]MDP3555607.1 hypothetical protein [Methylocystis sp.]